MIYERIGENYLEKNPIQNFEKYCKNKTVEIAACEQKTTREKVTFCFNTVFPLYFKIRAKKFQAAKPLAFSLHFLFRRDKITTPIRPQNSNVWTALKKDSAPIQFKFFEL